MKCKNIECSNETNGKNIYCSLKCRNIYVNKHLRDYSKNGDAIKNNSVKKYEIKKCKECGMDISYKKRKNIFCSHECSASYNNKHRIVNYKDGVKEKLRDMAYNNFFENVEQTKYEKKLKENNYEENPIFCKICKKKISYINYQKNKERKYCSRKCFNTNKKIEHLKYKSDFDIYKTLSKFKFNLNNYQNEFDFELIKENGWYKAKNNGDNINGISRDHKISIKEGFRRLINPLLLAHPANCELILNRENQSKHDKCSIEIENLLEKIKEFDKKYGNYYNNEIKIYIELSEINEIYKKHILV